MKTIKAESAPGFGSDSVTVRPSTLKGCIIIGVRTPSGTAEASLNGAQAQEVIDAIRKGLPDPVSSPEFVIR